MIMVGFVLFSFILQFTVSYGSSTYKILVLTSSSSMFNTSGVLPAVDLALSLINSSLLLNESTLSYSTVLDSQVSIIIIIYEICIIIIM